MADFATRRPREEKKNTFRKIHAKTSFLCDDHEKRTLLIWIFIFPLPPPFFLAQASIAKGLRRGPKKKNSLKKNSTDSQKDRCQFYSWSHCLTYAEFCDSSFIDWLRSVSIILSPYLDSFKLRFCQLQLFMHGRFRMGLLLFVDRCSSHLLVEDFRKYTQARRETTLFSQQQEGPLLEQQSAAIKYIQY